MSRALKETVEHLVKFETQALYTHQQPFQHKYEYVSENDHYPESYRIFAEHICKGEENAHHSGVDKYKRADTKEGNGVGDIGKNGFKQLKDPWVI